VSKSSTKKRIECFLTALPQLNKKGYDWTYHTRAKLLNPPSGARIDTSVLDEITPSEVQKFIDEGFINYGTKDGNRIWVKPPPAAFIK
jgi:hypothetical protein